MQQGWHRFVSQHRGHNTFFSVTFRPATYPIRPEGSFNRGKARRSVKLAVHLHLLSARNNILLQKLAVTRPVHKIPRVVWKQNRSLPSFDKHANGHLPVPHEFNPHPHNLLPFGPSLYAKWPLPFSFSDHHFVWLPTILLSLLQKYAVSPFELAHQPLRASYTPTESFLWRHEQLIRISTLSKGFPEQNLPNFVILTL
jgi:hypothetical protein